MQPAPARCRAGQIKRLRQGLLESSNLLCNRHSPEPASRCNLKAIIRMRCGAREALKIWAPRRGIDSPMTDSAIAATPATTPLAALLDSAARPAKLAEYRCVLTPQELDAPCSGNSRPDRGRRGPRSGMAAPHRRARRRPFPLAERHGHQHGQRFAFEWRRLEPGAERAGPHSGRPDGVARRRSIWNWRSQRASTDRLLAHLEHFIIMDDVELVPLGEDGDGETAVGLTGPEGKRSAGAHGAAGRWPSP